ncbi:SpaA isopeptide-forming pilin-related protein [Pseudobutyrivibrio sp. MD2005]|uniref:SpaA isopeptide-forming pilin-related protein n=1 Tax=Pseudobutyrivibrio sp. MD2005 TaxID=1410616 RepID=UPI000481BF47|nr:SpaA isopeptide-forming pilin-related protein [Pseudobutyrivibrio sp. MD2005]
MRKNPMLNRIMSLGLALALFVSSPASVYAVDASESASAETIVEETSEEAVDTAEGESASNDDTATSRENESDDSKNQDQASDESKSDEKDSKSEEKVNKEETEKTSDEKASEEQTDKNKKEKAEEEKAKEEKELTEKESEEETSYSYKSNGDGTHIKSWTDEDGEAHEETEKCEFDEDGKCKFCEYEKEEEITLSDEDSLVKITASKSVLNGAIKVTVDEITEESDESQYNDMAEALNNETGDAIDVIDFVAYDINLIDKAGNIVEPEGDVKVEFTNLSIDGLDDETLTTEVYHYEDASVDKMEDVKSDDSSVEMTTNHFSTYIIAVNGDSSDAIYTSNYINIIDKSNNHSWKTLNDISNFTSDGRVVQVRVYVDGELKEESGYAYFFSTKSDKTVTFSVTGGAASYRLNEVKTATLPKYEKDKLTTKEDYSEFSATLDNYKDSKKVYYIDVYVESCPFKVDLFQYNDTNYYGNSGLSMINYVAKNNNSNQYLLMNYGGSGDKDWNNDHSSPGRAYQGLADDELDSNGMIKFSKYGTPGYFTVANRSSEYDYNTATYTYGSGYNNNWYTKAYYNVSFPFQTEDGYYVFDSATSSAKFDEQTGVVTATDSNDKGFWPFGEDHFGMHFTQKFNMTKTGTNEGEPCVFEFSGDDDVWVYVDGKLVLDLGGIHGVVSGTINFQTGECTVSGIYNSSSSKYGTSFNMYKAKDGNATIFDKSAILNNGEHTLQVYYLERGSGKSNCKIKFNMPVVDKTAEPVNPLEFRKVDSDDTSKGLTGVEFTLVSSDGTLTVLDEEENSTVTSDSTGLVSFSKTRDENGNVTDGIKQGIYILTETKSADGYKLPTEAWYVNVESDGNGGSKYTIEGSNQEYIDGSYLIKNEKKSSSAGTVEVNKTAEVSDWESRVYEIDLQASITKAIEGDKQDIVLVLDTSGSMAQTSKTKTISKNDVVGNNKYWLTWLQGSDGYYYFYSGDYDAWGKYSSKYDEWVEVGSAKVPNKFTYSYYESNDRLESMKNAASSLVTSLSGTNSRVAIVTFGDSAEVKLGLTECSERNVETIKATISGLTATGATRMDLGLEKVISDVLNGNSRTDNYNNNVILFTDGVPTTHTEFDDKVADAAINAAEDLRNATNVSKTWNNYENTEYKNYGCASKIYFVKYDNNDADSTKMSNFAKSITGETNITDGNYKYIQSVSDMSNISDAFNEVLKDIYEGGYGTVVDEIDNRFELVYKNSSGEYVSYKDGEKITATTINASGNEVSVNGVISIEDGLQKITWSNVYINFKMNDLPGFESKFLVKAKEDFLGGNAITTNGSYSGVITEDGDFKPFPQPRANVKLLDFELSDAETTILLNDTFEISSEEYKGQLIALLSDLICTYTDNNGTVHSIDNVFTSSSITINDDGTIRYRYPGTDYVGTINILDVSEMKKTSLLSKETTGDNLYYCEFGIKYIPDTYDDIEAVGTTQSEFTRTGKIKINVVDAGIFAKKIGGTTFAGLNGAVYAVYDENGKEVSRSEESTKYSIDGVDYSGLMILDKLGVGKYTVKEIQAPNGYAKSDEEFEIEISRTYESWPSYYTMNISKKDNESNSTVSLSNIQFSVITCDGGYFFDDDGKSVDEISPGYLLKADEKDTTVVLNTAANAAFEAFDEVAYTLPKTGGSGVYVYTIGGILLMIAGALLLYKNKNNKNK